MNHKNTLTENTDAATPYRHKVNKSIY